MRRTVRNVSLILFVVIVLGCGFAVLYLGTSTGLTFGGSGTRIQDQSGSKPVYGQVGWLRNTAPWPITIESITTNARNASKTPKVYLENEQKAPTKESGKLPSWALNASHVPYQLDGGALRYLGFALTPTAGTVGEMTSITVNYTGPLGLRFHQTFVGTRIAAGSSSLPPGVMGKVPYGNPDSLDAYIVELRAVLLQPDPKTVAQVMGNNASDAQVKAFLASQKAYATADSVSSTVVTPDGRQQRIVFYKGDPTRGGLPPIEVEWAHYRWNVVTPGS